MARKVAIYAQVCDAANFQCDALVLRYGSGAAGVVADSLGLNAGELYRELGKDGAWRLMPGRGKIGASIAAFFRDVPVSRMTTADVRRFSAESLRVLRDQAPKVRRVGMTLHAVQIGLDLPRSLRAQLDGLSAALAAGECPAGLERIAIISRYAEETREIERILDAVFPSGTIAAADPPGAASAVRPAPPAFDVFISCSSSDVEHARKVYDFLSSQGLTVFLSRETLPKLGVDEYHAQIDLAIEQAKHLFLVASTRDRASSKWVQYEWRLFLGEVLAGRKAGNLIAVIAGQMSIADLPISLRNREVVRCTPAEFPRLLKYARA